MPTAFTSDTTEVTVLHFANTIALFKLANFVFFISPRPSFFRLIDSLHIRVLENSYSSIFFLLALQPPSGVVFYSPLTGFSLLACEVS